MRLNSIFLEGLSYDIWMEICKYFVKSNKDRPLPYRYYLEPLNKFLAVIRYPSAFANKFVNDAIHNFIINTVYTPKATNGIKAPEFIKEIDARLYTKIVDEYVGILSLLISLRKYDMKNNAHRTQLHNEFTDFYKYFYNNYEENLPYHDRPLPLKQNEKNSSKIIYYEDLSNFATAIDEEKKFYVKDYYLDIDIKNYKLRAIYFCAQMYIPKAIKNNDVNIIDFIIKIVEYYNISHQYLYFDDVCYIDININTLKYLLNIQNKYNTLPYYEIISLLKTCVDKNNLECLKYLIDNIDKKLYLKYDDLLHYLQIIYYNKYYDSLYYLMYTMKTSFSIQTRELLDQLDEESFITNDNSKNMIDLVYFYVITDRQDKDGRTIHTIINILTTIFKDQTGKYIPYMSHIFQVLKCILEKYHRSTTDILYCSFLTERILELFIHKKDVNLIIMTLWRETEKFGLYNTFNNKTQQYEIISNEKLNDIINLLSSILNYEDFYTDKYKVRLMYEPKYGKLELEEYLVLHLIKTNAPVEAINFLILSREKFISSEGMMIIYKEAGKQKNTKLRKFIQSRNIRFF